MKTPVEDRFFAKVEWGENRYNGTRCLLWTASGIRGYGRFYDENSKSVLAHRWLYERWVSPIPEGLVIDHLCRTPACVNLMHLEPVTQAENMHRGATANRTHCSRGHEFTPENVYTPPSRFQRMCRICNRQRQREGYARKRVRDAE